MIGIVGWTPRPFIISHREWYRPLIYIFFLMWILLHSFMRWRSHACPYHLATSTLMAPPVQEDGTITERSHHEWYRPLIYIVFLMWILYSLLRWHLHARPYHLAHVHPHGGTCARRWNYNWDKPSWARLKETNRMWVKSPCLLIILSPTHSPVLSHQHLPRWLHSPRTESIDTFLRQSGGIYSCFGFQEMDPTYI